jgi:hypothetical protein
VFKTQLMELQNITSVLTLSPRTRSLASVLPPEPHEGSTALFGTPYGCTGLEVTQRAKKPTRYRRKLLSVRIPTWISSTIWEAELTKISTSGWTFGLTSYAIVDWKSPFFRLLSRAGLRICNTSSATDKHRHSFTTIPVLLCYM